MDRRLCVVGVCACLAVVVEAKETKGFVITLVPKDESGKVRIREFFEDKQKKGLPLGGKAEMNDDSTCTLKWTLPKMLRSDRFADQIIAQMTKGLDSAIKDMGNLTYTVDRIEPS